MKPRLLSTRLVIGALLFAIAVLMFNTIKSYNYFTPTPAVSHIIDSHLTPNGSDTSFNQYMERFFDAAYVKEAARQYDPSRYMRSFYIVDFFFPVIYFSLFLALAAYWKGTHFYKVLKAAAATCMVLDLLENTAFAYYLFHQEGNMHVAVAFFTTLKSILFVLCFIIASGSWLAACISQLKKHKVTGPAHI